MAKENSNWPEYFQPRIEKTGQQPEIVRIPQKLLDVFYTCETVGGPTQLMAVVGCIGGEISLVHQAEMAKLPADIQGQIQTLKVANHGRFRAVVTSQLDVFFLSALEQKANTTGFNDPVYLYGEMQARAAIDQNSSSVVDVKNEGRLTVSRTDLLRAFCSSLNAVFTDPTQDSEQVYNLLVPTSSAAEVAKGRGMTLVYPLVDQTMFNRADNEVIVMRIMYDLLIAMQKDLQQAGVARNLANRMLPVPNRRRIEVELEQDGYKIQGDEAIRVSNPAHKNQADTFLSRLRQSADIWLSPRILLPPQATPQDYQKIATGILEAVKNAEDQRSFEALLARVILQTGPVDKVVPPVVTPKPARVEPAKPVVRPEPAKAQPLPPLRPVAKPAVSKPTAKPADKDWSADFTPMASKQPAPKTDWWSDFTGEANGTSTVLSNKDWAGDYEADKTAEKPKTQLNSTWASDFDPIQPKSDDQKLDWKNDFKS